MPSTDTTSPSKRGKGRPRPADAPPVPWLVVDRLLVFGERRVDAKTGFEGVHYPSLSDVARRYQVSRTLIWQYAHKHRVYDRRAEAKLKTEARAEAKIIEKLSDARATATVNVIGVVDQFMLRFEEDLRNGRVRTDSAADFDRLARLRELMSGSSDARVELQGGLTLEVLQARHRAQRGQVAQLTPQITGTVEPERVEERTELVEDSPSSPSRVPEAAATTHSSSRPRVPPADDRAASSDGDATHGASRVRVGPPADSRPAAGVGEGSEVARAIDLLELGAGGVQ